MHSKSLVKLTVTAALSLVSACVWASGFQLAEESFTNAGNAHAGDAAQVDDASAEYYNPASMTYIKNTAVSTGGALVVASTEFDAGGNIYINDRPTTTTTSGISGGTANGLPNFHLVQPIDDRWAVGFGVTVPFGLASDYATDSEVAGYATETSIMGVNLNPSVAYALNDRWSVGLGFDAMHVNAEYDDTLLDNDLSGWGYGYNVGLMYQPSASTRVGISYRSQMDESLSGDSVSSINGNTTTANTSIDFPATSMLSVNKKLNAKWELLSTLSYTQWSSIDDLFLDNTSAGTKSITVAQYYKNTWSLALGANYRRNDRWTLKMGAGVDQTPTKDGYRDIRMPDADRLTLACGARWKATKKMVLDFGYEHIFMKDADIDGSIDIEGGSVDERITGLSHSSANVVGVQMSYFYD